MKTISISSQAELPKVARAVLDSLGDRRIAVFRGAMGAGKTTLISEIVALTGSTDNVTSPTFAIVNNYHTASGNDIFHFDFYRIDRIEEAFDLGYEEYFYSGALCLIEWGEKIEELLPDDMMEIRIDIDSADGRTFTIE